MPTGLQPHRQKEERDGSGSPNISLLKYMRDRTWPANQGAQDLFESLRVGENVHVRIADLRSMARGSH